MKVQNAETINILDAELQPWPLPAESIEEGNPDAFGTVLSKSPDSRIVRGVWSCTPGVFRWSYTYDELVVVISGRATVELENGDEIALGPGDMAFIERGQSCKWRILETIRKGFHADSPNPLPF